MSRPLRLCWLSGPAEGTAGWVLRNYKRMDSLSPERVDIDEASSINGLVIALHVHAAGKKQQLAMPGHAPFPYTHLVLPLLSLILGAMYLARRHDGS